MQIQTIDLTPLCNALIAVLAAFLTPRIIKWLSAVTSEKQRCELREWAKIAVAAAEQIFPREAAEKKKKYVVDFLTENGFDVEFSEIDAAVESAVLALHAGLYGGGGGTA